MSKTFKNRSLGAFLTRRNVVLAAPFVLVGATSEAVPIATLRKPTGPVKLKVDGDIAIWNLSNEAAFDQELLDELPQAEFATSTIWTEGVGVFSGPAFKGLLDFLGAGPGTIIASALNEYSVDLSRSIIEDSAPIIASRINGEVFSVRENGPLWIIFPYDQSSRYRSEVVFSMSVWQLSRLTITDV